MLTFKSAYKLQDGVHVGEVLDFPGTVSCGATLDEARRNLSAALLDMAETNLLRGEPLPLPDPARTDPEEDLEEPIYLVAKRSEEWDNSNLPKRVFHFAGVAQLAER